MKIVRGLLDSVSNAIKITDHLVYSTYPVVKDPKLLVKIVERINDSFGNIINVVVRYEKLYKRIPNSFNIEDINKLKKITSKYNITDSEMAAMNKVATIIKGINESNMRLSQKDKIIVFSNDFRQQSITFNEIKELFYVLKEVNKKVYLALLKDPLIERYNNKNIFMTKD